MSVHGQFTYRNLVFGESKGVTAQLKLVCFMDKLFLCKLPEYLLLYIVKYTRLSDYLYIIKFISGQRLTMQYQWNPLTQRTKNDEKNYRLVKSVELDTPMSC